MGRRIFIAINLPEDIKKRLANFSDDWPDLPVRWIKAHNLHITLAFLGFIRDEGLIEIIKKTKEAVKNHSSFSINLNKICYGPENVRVPRMIWAEGEKSEELAGLQKDIESALLSGKNISLKEAEAPRAFSPHITLGRIRQIEWRKMEQEEIPEINKEINFNFEAESIEIMESELKKGGPIYSILESIDLKD